MTSDSLPPNANFNTFRTANFLDILKKLQKMEVQPVQPTSLSYAHCRTCQTLLPAPTNLKHFVVTCVQCGFANPIKDPPAGVLLSTFY